MYFGVMFYLGRTEEVAEAGMRHLHRRFPASFMASEARLNPWRLRLIFFIHTGSHLEELQITGIWVRREANLLQFGDQIILRQSDLLVGKAFLVTNNLDGR